MLGGPVGGWCKEGMEEGVKDGLAEKGSFLLSPEGCGLASFIFGLVPSVPLSQLHDPCLVSPPLTAHQVRLEVT